MERERHFRIDATIATIILCMMPWRSCPVMWGECRAQRPIRCWDFLCWHSMYSTGSDATAPIAFHRLALPAEASICLGPRLASRGAETSSTKEVLKRMSPWRQRVLFGMGQRLLCNVFGCGAPRVTSGFGSSFATHSGIPDPASKIRRRRAPRVPVRCNSCVEIILVAVRTKPG